MKYFWAMKNKMITGSSTTVDAINRYYWAEYMLLNWAKPTATVNLLGLVR